MGKYIVIDGGTTNTRLNYVENGQILEAVKLKMGVRSTIDHPGMLQQNIRDTIGKLTESHGKAECIIAAGMITSDLGLYKLDHILAPAGIAELHAGIVRVELPEIADIPFYFIPGVRKQTDSFLTTDMMRGEECEFVGLSGLAGTDAVFVLPGSHSKIIQTDEQGRISDFATLLTGEMIAALSEGTILKNSVDLSSGLDGEYLVKGCQFAVEVGLNEALFKVRIMQTVFNETSEHIYSFFLGCVLSGEIQQLLAVSARKVVIAGQKQLKEATAAILEKISDKEVTCVDDSFCQNANVYGMIRIYEHKGE